MERSASDPASRYSSPTQRVFFCVLSAYHRVRPTSRAELFWATHVTRVGVHYPRRAPALASRATLPCRRAPSPPPSRRLASHRCGSRVRAHPLARPPRARRGPRIERRLGPVRGDSLERLERRVRGVVPFAPSIRRPSSSRGDRRRLRRAVHRAEARRAGRVEGRSPPARHPRRSRRAVRVQAPALRARQRDHEGVGGVPHLRGPPRAHRHRISPRRRRVRATRRRRRRRRRRPPRRRDTAGVRLPAAGAGTASSVESVPGAKDHAVPLSTLEDAQRLAGALRDAETKRLRSDSNPADVRTLVRRRGRRAVSGVELRRASSPTRTWTRCGGKLEGGTPRLERGNHAGIPGGTERSGDATVGILRGDDSRRREGDEGGRGDDARSARARRAALAWTEAHAKNVSTSSTSCAGPSDKKSNRRRRGRSRGRTVEKFSPTPRFRAVRTVRVFAVGDAAERRDRRLVVGRYSRRW